MYADRTLYGYGPIKSLTGEDDYGYVYLTATGKFSIRASEYVGSDYDRDQAYNELAGSESLVVAYKDRSNDVYEDEVTSCGSGEDVAIRDVPTFPVLTAMRMLYNGNDKCQECVKCGYRIFWGGYAGDAQDWVVAGMVHWYAHRRDSRSKVASFNALTGKRN